MPRDWADVVNEWESALREVGFDEGVNCYRNLINGAFDPDDLLKELDMVQVPSTRVCGDGMAAVDTLGRMGLVEALATFVLDPNTQTPLNVSIEGAWGSGKSSVMKLLEGELAGAD